ncbi:MAG TPA: DUF1573 domain-containing protein [Gemmataceae bacterium]|nr:DUF1573 domain-containing protein [Gemmataceae bacterium]
MARHTLLIIGILIAGSARAGEADKFFSERVKDFGTVPFGPTLVHHFKLTNTTEHQVFIASARVSCGCVSASIPTNTLKPGESTYLTAYMDTKRFIGPKEVIVYVQFSQPYEEVSLSVRANRNDNFSKSAEALTIGQVRKGAEGTGTIQVTMRNDSGFELREAQSGTDFVKAGFKLLRRDRGEVVYELSATLKPGLDTGVWTTDLMFNTTSPVLPVVRVPVVVDVVAPITATPAAVQFPAVKVGDKKELSVVVKGDKPFKILDVKGGDDLVKAVADGSEAKAAHIVRLVFQPSAAGELTKTITVVTDNGAENKITIPVRGKAKMDD